MAAVVGVLCDDGVVVGSDDGLTQGDACAAETVAASASVVGGDVLLGCTGRTGLAQRFHGVLTELREDSRFAELAPAVIARRACASAMEDCAATRCPPGQLEALAAFASSGDFHLCEFCGGDFQPEFKTPQRWFAALGGARPALASMLAWLGRVFFRQGQPRVDEGILAAAWALRHLSASGLGHASAPPQIAVLRRDFADLPPRARLLSADEHRRALARIEAAEARLASCRETFSAGPS